MNTKHIKLSAIAAAALACGVLVSEAALAQGPAPRPPVSAPGQAGGPMAGGRGGMMMRGQMGGPDDSLVAIAAKTLGLAQADLIAALKDGKTIADVANEKGVDPAKIADAFVAEKVADRQAMVASGRWSEAQLATMTAMMKANIAQKLSQPLAVQGNGTGFVDADGDGVCDSMPNRHNPPMQRRNPGRWNT